VAEADGTWACIMWQWMPKTLYMVAMDPRRFTVLGSVRIAGFSLHVPTKLNGLAYGCCLEPKTFFNLGFLFALGNFFCLLCLFYLVRLFYFSL
jgi:hypothetical protein